MLSRTADHLFWMARYTERAENTARMLDVSMQMSLLPQSAHVREQTWRAVLGISELQSQFDARYPVLTPREVLDFMVHDPTNSSSIYCCLQAARENARAVRGALTTEVWETHNIAWLELQRLLKEGIIDRDPSEFFEWVKFRSHLSRGVTVGTMLEDEALHFIRLGTHLERADNTARILDVKFYALAEEDQYQADPETVSIDVHKDFYHWAAMLRSVSAFEVYRKVYRDIITPERVAELLILRPDMPRSLLASLTEVCQTLSMVKNDRSHETQRRAGMLRAELEFGRVEDILQPSLHGYLSQFLERISDLGNRISQDFLVPLGL